MPVTHNVFNFRNMEAELVSKNKGKSESAGTNTTLNFVPYDSATDLGTGAVQRWATDAARHRVPASPLKSMGSGIKESVTYNFFNKLFKSDYEEDPNFNIKEFITNDLEATLLKLNEEEIDHIKDSVSEEDLRTRLNEIKDYRGRMQDLGDHPIWGIAGAIIGDSPTIIFPSAAGSALTPTVANSIRILGNTFDFGAALYTQNELGQSYVNTMIVGGFAALDSILMARKYLKGVLNDEKLRLLEKDLEPIPELNRNSPKSKNTETLVPDPDNPTPEIKMPQNRDLEHDIGTSMNMGSKTQEDIPVVTKVDEAVPNNSYNESYLDTLVDLSGEEEKITSKAILDIDLLDSPARNTNPATARNVGDHLIQQTLGDGDNIFLTEMWESIKKNLPDDIEVHFVKNYESRGVTNIRKGGKATIALSSPKALKGTKSKIKDILDSMTPAEKRNFFHEALHAATSYNLHLGRKGKLSGVQAAGYKSLETIYNYTKNYINKGIKEELKGLAKDSTIKYHLKSMDEFLAGLMNSYVFKEALMNIPSMTKKESILRRGVKSLMQLLGFKPSNTAFSDTVDAFHDFMTNTDTMSRGSNIPNFVSATMKPIAEEAERHYNAAKDAIPTQPTNKINASAAGLNKGIKGVFKKNFVLHGQIGEGSEDLANLLVANPLKEGGRDASVADYARYIQSIAHAQASVTEKAIEDLVRSQMGVKYLDMFFNRKNFVDAVKKVENEFNQYMHYAYKQDISGLEVAPPPANIKSVVDAHTNSGWSETMWKHIQESGLAGDGNTIKQSKYYLPVRYSRERVRDSIRSGKFNSKNLRSLLKQAVDDTFPELDSKLNNALVTKWHENILNGTTVQKSNWRRGAESTVSAMLENKGLPEDFIDMVVNDKKLLDIIQPKSPEISLRGRGNFDYLKMYDTGDNTMLSLSEIMDNRVTKNIAAYNNRMSGRIGFAYAGYPRLGTLETTINKMINDLPPNVNRPIWEGIVNDTIDSLMGYPVRGDIPDLLRGAGYLANSVSLKNSGLYGLTDLSLALQEFGMAKTLRYMMKGGLFKELKSASENKELASRLYDTLNATSKEDMRFKYIHNYTEDNFDLASKPAWLGLTKNLASGVHTANGLRAVHSGMSNLYSAVLRDEVIDVIKQGKESKSWKALERFGMDDELLGRLKAEYTPDGLFSFKNQTDLELVMQRRMDYLMQMSRLGETGHFTSLNPIGRLIVGYNAFSMGATTRIMGKMVANKKYTGLAMMFMYQMPLMLMTSYAKSVLDGHVDTLTGKELITSSLANMGMLGIAGNVINIFSDNSPRGELAILAVPVAFSKALNTLAQGGSVNWTRIVPYTQTAIPLRAIINNIDND